MLNHGRNNSLSHGCFNILLFPPFLYNRWKGVALLQIDRITLVTPSYSVKPLCVGQHLHPCFSFCIPFFFFLTGEALYKAKLPERRDTKLLTLLSMLKEEVCRLTQEADEPKEAGEKSRYSTLVLQCKKKTKTPCF